MLRRRRTLDEIGIEFEPAPELTITDPEVLRVLADPLRLRLVQHNLGKPWTVKDASRALGISQTKLYYHVNLLETHGLIRVHSTRVVSGIIEKSYRITAYSFRPAQWTARSPSCSAASSTTHATTSPPPFERD
jgi:DNA-binding transcriptional ArsR family regulator